MARKKKLIPEYGKTLIKGVEYYRTRIEDADGKRVSLYALTAEELYDKVEEAKQLIKEAKFRRSTPTVKEYCEKWLLMQSANIRVTTLNDYRSKVKNYIIAPLGHKYMAEVTPDDVRLAILPAAKKSASVYRSVQMLYKSIFASAEESNIIDHSPCTKLSAKGGVPQKDKDALSDEQAEQLLSAIKEHNRPVISSELKTKAARRDIPLPKQLEECLIEAKENSTSEFVVSNRDGGPLSYTQVQRVWKYIETRSTKERSYVRYSKGEKVVHTVKPVLGQKASHNGNVVYSLDFHVTPHQLRHTYITNLIYASVDPKTVQYLAGHENSKITMDIYAKVKYNKPEQLASVIHDAFN